MQSFAFPQWDNALMHDEKMVDSDSPPPTEAHPSPPVKLSPVSFPTHQPLPLRPADTSGVISPDLVHSRSNSYSQSSSASSGPDTFSPAYLFNEMPEDPPSFAYRAQNTSQTAQQQHLSPPEPFSQFQYPSSSHSSAGANHPHSSPQYLNRRESDHVLNISYSRQSPRAGAIETPSSNGHRRAITEPQTLRAIVQCSALRGHHSAPLSAHPIRVPSPPPVPAIDREALARKYSAA